MSAAPQLTQAECEFIADVLKRIRLFVPQEGDQIYAALVEKFKEYRNA